MISFNHFNHLDNEIRVLRRRMDALNWEITEILEETLRKFPKISPEPMRKARINVVKELQVVRNKMVREMERMNEQIRGLG